MTNTRHRSIWALLLAFLALCLLYNALTPLGEGPDEPGHAGYVFFLAREGRFPLQCASPCQSDVPGSGHHPPLAYLLALPALLWLPPELRAVDLPGNPRFTWAGGDQVNAAAHGSREQWPWDAQVWAWRLTRLGSTLAGLATVALTYLAALAVQRRMGGEDEPGALPWLAAALVAFNPQFVFTSSLVTNDALLAALSALLLWLAVDGRHSARGAAAIGLALGLALITKQSALLLVPLALGWCLAGGADRPLWSRLRLSLGLMLAVALVATAISGWWYLRNWQVYGDPFGMRLFQSEFITQAFDATSPAAWLGALATLHSSFWARFGWMNLPASDWLIWLYGLVVLAAAGGWVRIGWYERRVSHWALLALFLPALAWVLSFALTAGLVAWQGRMLFPAMAAIAIFLAQGFLAWRVDLRLWRVTTFLLFLVAIWLPVAVIRPAYPFRTVPEPAARAIPGVPTYARFAYEMELGALIHTWRIDGDLRAGSTIRVMLLWNALSRQNRNWYTFVHVVNAQGEIVAEDNRPPGDDLYPMRQWLAGDWIEGRYEVALPAELPPGRYTLNVGLWDPRTNRRAAYFNDDNVRDPEGNQVGLTTLFISDR